jgi:hypothetical protein
MLAMGLLNLAKAAGLLIGATISGAGSTAGFGEYVLTGLALTTLQAGEYIRRTNPIWPSRGGHWVS